MSPSHPSELLCYLFLKNVILRETVKGGLYGGHASVINLNILFCGILTPDSVLI